MATAAGTIEPKRTGGLARYVRVVHVIASAEFKLKYSGSALGYVWSIAKPLGLFAMLYIVFGRFMRLGNIPHYPAYLLVGIVLWYYFFDATTLSMFSFVARGSLVSKLAFPRLIVPLSATTTATMTLGVNIIAVAVFVALSKVTPALSWVLIPFLLIYLFVLTIGVGMILSPLYVRLRDVSQVWELFLQLMFYASPIIYPASFLPPWWKPIVFLSPFVQIMQDTRALVVPGAPVDTPTTIYGGWWGQLIPFGVAMLIVIGGYLYFRREAPSIAERI